MNVDIFYYLNNTQPEKILKVAKMLNGIQSYFQFRPQRVEQTEICRTETVSWNVFRKVQIPIYGQHTIYITRKAFSDNWFSHEEAQYAVISTNDWEKNFDYIPVELFLIYQIAQAVINFATGLSERTELNMTHLDTRGCMFDQCMNKCDIVVGMKKGLICNDCKSILSHKLSDLDALYAVQKMLDCVKESIANELPEE